MPIPGGWELILILVVLVLLFGAKKLPDMARSIGQSARVFKGEMKGLKDDGGEAKDGDAKDGDAKDGGAKDGGAKDDTVASPADRPAAGPPAPLPAAPPAASAPHDETTRAAGQRHSSTGQ